MKKLVNFMVLFLIFLTFIAEAGDLLNLDFTKQNQYIAGLKKGDSAEFYLNGERNIIIVDKITPVSADITAFIALNSGNNPYYVTLVKDKILKIDVERDDIDDLYVTFYESDEDLEHTYLLMKIPDVVQVGGDGENEIKREKREYDIYIIIGFVLAAGLLFLLFKYKKK